MRSAKKVDCLLGFALAILATPAAAQTAPPAPTAWQRAIAAGYKAAMLCSGIFDAGRTEAQIEKDELRGIYPEYAPIVPTLTATVDRVNRSVSVAFDDKLPPRRVDWWPDAGCVAMPVGHTAPLLPYGDKAVATPPPADPRPWPRGDGGIKPRPSRPLAAVIDRAFDRASYGRDSETVGVVVLKDGQIIAEKYRDGFGPFVSNRTWSVAKSITGTLVGLAGIDPKKPAGLAAWSFDSGSGQNDPRAKITIDNLLRMASGLHSDTAGNRTDALYFGGTPVAQDIVQWQLEAPPGTRFRYANNDILLAIRAVREKSIVAKREIWPNSLLLEPLGLTHTRIATDWQGDFLLSSQVWSTARDLARLGQFWLQDGVWQGKRLLPEGWMKYMTTPSGPQPEGRPEGYGATMWLHGARQGLPDGTYSAQGNRGQSVTVVPSAGLVVVRRGEDPGVARFAGERFVADILAAMK